MIAQRFRPLGWAAGVATAACGLYLVSLQVAAERGKLEAVEAQIASARRDLRQLQTELGSRASLRQLEAWNGEVLSLAAPKAAQFVSEPAQLVALNLDTADEGAAPPAMLAEYTTAPPAPVAAVVPAKPERAAPKTDKAKTDTPKSVAAPIRTAALKPKPVAKREKTTRVAMIEPRTMIDLGRAASMERRTRP